MVTEPFSGDFRTSPLASDLLDLQMNNALISTLLLSIEPTLEIETVFKQLYTRLVFIKGSMMNATDLKRVRVSVKLI